MPRDRELDYADFVPRLNGEDSALAEQVRGFTGISAVLRWMQATGRTASRVDIVGQDEFHYDFLVALGSGRWVSFGVT